MGSLLYDDPDVPLDDIENIISRVKSLQELSINHIPKAKQVLMNYKAKMVDRYNQKAKPNKFFENDLVMVEHRPPKQSSFVITTWVGP
jgi:hypothetical protein